MKVPIVPHFPPAERRSPPLESEPRRDVRFVVEVGHDDFFSLSQDVSYRKTDDTNERSGVHTERYLGRFTRIQECSYAFPCLLYGGVYLLAMTVAAATLHVAGYEVMADRIQNGLRYLRSRAIIEKNKVVPGIQGRK